MRTLHPALAAAILLTACPNPAPSPGSDASVAQPDASTLAADASEVCADECSPGAKVCAGEGAYRVCGQYDSDPCAEQSEPIACGAGTLCVGGVCQATCRDECIAGSGFCPSRTVLQTCGNFDGDSCLEFGSGVQCGTSTHCESGACVPDTVACTDECQSGTAICAGDSVRTCGSYDDDACTDLSAPAACPPGETCRNGACASACADECPAQGERECLEGGVRTCGQQDADPCLEWSAPVACAASQSCSQGVCSDTCVDECASSGQASCSADGSSVRQCGQFDADPCLDLSTPTPCPGSDVCKAGACVASCSDECALGDKRCGADGKSVETCGNYDGDSCLELGGAAPCAGGAACSGGACAVACTDECATAGEAACVSGQAATHSCGEFDTDPCLDWSSATACASYEVCQAGACVLGPTPGKVLLNEVVYDATGTDGAVGNDLFLELWGPAGLALNGFAVVAVNGANGADYASIALDGKALGSDGFFVIAHSKTGLAASLVDLSDDKVDFQNAPDSLQLRWHGRVVDALAYGTFGATDVAAGEGTPAGTATNGKSLSRSAAHQDTDDNASDFTSGAATPGADPGSCSSTCSPSGSTRCTVDGKLQTCADANADGCTEWGAAASCPGTQTCVGTACASCSSECTSGATRCSGSQVQTCADANLDGCTEWGTARSCPTGQTCTGTACAACSGAACTAGATRCSATQIQTCVSANGCTDWGAPASCPAGFSCDFFTDRCTHRLGDYCYDAPLIAVGQTLTGQTLTGFENTYSHSGGTSPTGQTYCAGSNGLDRAWMVEAPANSTLTVTLTPQGTMKTYLELLDGSASNLTSVCNGYPVCYLNQAATGVNQLAFVNGSSAPKKLILLVDTDAFATLSPFSVAVSATPLPTGAAGDVCAQPELLNGDRTGVTLAGFRDDYPAGSCDFQVGPDRVYRATTPAYGALSVTAKIPWPSYIPDPAAAPPLLHVSILDAATDCAAPTCLASTKEAWARQQTTGWDLDGENTARFYNFTGTARDVLVVVDSVVPYGQTFDLLLRYEPLEKGDTILDATPLSLSTNWSGAMGSTCAYTTHDSSPCRTLARDRYYAIDVPMGETLEVRRNSSDYADQIYVVAFSGPEFASCFSYAWAAGSISTFEFTNTVPLTRYYLVVAGVSGACGQFSFSARLKP
ncbi:MAG: PPC domain-containing protein [Myxococcales bacterium]